MYKFSIVVAFYVLFQEDSFLEDVNMILNTADIPNLYENEERLEIIEKVWICWIYVSYLLSFNMCHK